MEETQKKEIIKIIDERGVDFIEDMVSAKEDLDILAKSVKEKYELPVGKFKKMCEFRYLGNKEEEKKKALLVFDMFEDMFEEK